MRNITEFIEKLPCPTSKTVEECLGISMLNNLSIQSASVELANRGVIGMIPFARYGRLPYHYHLKEPKELYALRLLPGIVSGQLPVVICFEEMPMARTIAENISEFAAGALAFAGIREELTEKKCQDILAFSNQWGISPNTKSILEVYKIAKHDEATLLSACEKTKYYEVFGALVEQDKTRLLEKIQRLMEKYPEDMALVRTYADMQIRGNSGVDVSEIVWRMIKDDIICDSNVVMRSASSWIPMKNSIRWLRKFGVVSYTKEYPLLYEAALAWTQDDCYQGEMHLAFAKEIAEKNPTLAYTQTANAAAIYAAATGKVPLEAIIYAKELATRNRWEELSQVLDWAGRLQRMVPADCRNLFFSEKRGEQALLSRGVNYI